MAKGNILRAVEAPADQTQQAKEPIRLDIGCGKTKQDGWIGIDAIAFGQEYVHDIRKGLPFFDDNSVDEVRSSHFVEHLTGKERVDFFNELYRVMKDGATALIITPNWSHECAYGDPTHQWPPMSRWYPLYLHRDWRAGNAPHVGYNCHFDHSLVGTWDQSIELRNMETKAFMMDKNVNAMRDLIVTLTARKS